MKCKPKLDPKQEAKEIIEDYYHLLNTTYAARYHHARQHAIAMIDRRLETPNLHPDEKEHWFIIKQEMLQL